jgi:hypothetical protein
VRARRFVVYSTLVAGVALVLVTGVLSPRWHDGHGCRSAETAAIATLRNLVSAQEQFRDGKFADENGNGIGEYGSLGELSAGAPVRGDKALDPPLLPGSFRTVGTLGVSRARRSGYWFQFHFALPGGKTRTERLRGGLRAGDLDAALAEKFWCAYAWPVKHGLETGRRTFFVNQEGDILATDDHRYSGKHGPAATAAFAPKGTGITGAMAMSGKGRDGNTWKAVN